MKLFMDIARWVSDHLQYRLAGGTSALVNSEEITVREEGADAFLAVIDAMTQPVAG
jgi:hypothetical protein